MKNVGKGFLIVIEGGDGSGKGTQSKMLCDYLSGQEIPFQYIDFPDYESFYGKMIAQFLRGEFGSINVVSPYLAALLFALDRREKANSIQAWLSAGRIVVANRYVTSNIAHQGSKFATEKERNTFITWLENLEYKENGMPREHVVIYLSVPSQISHDLTHTKSERSYLQGKKVDIQESDMDYRKSTESVYEYLAQAHTHWIKISCTKHGTILSREEIHEKIMKALQTVGIVNLS